MDHEPLVSVVMPVRNEAAHLARALAAIDAQTYPADRIELLVVDGGSTDGTVAIVRRRVEADPRTRLLGGPGVNTPLAMQIGIDAARGSIVAKVDGHGWVNEQFLAVAVAGLVGDQQVGCIGGIVAPVASTEVERAIAIGRFSRLGVGVGVYTLTQRAQDVETVQCGVYRRSALLESGGFDPALAFGEDEEANFRLRQRGWRIRLDPAMRFSYRVRPSMGALFRQYFRYGRARVAVVRRHPSFFRPKHATPAALILTLVGSALISIVFGRSLPVVAAWLGYGLLLIVGGAWLAARAKFGRPDLVAAALLALHFGYGLGTLRGLVDSAQRGAEGSERLGSSAVQHDGVAEQPKPEQDDH